MFGMVRKASSRPSIRPWDRQRSLDRYYAANSLGMRYGWSEVVVGGPTRSFFHHGFQSIAVQRILEGALGTSNSECSNDKQETIPHRRQDIPTHHNFLWRREFPSSLKYDQPALSVTGLGTSLDVDGAVGLFLKHRNEVAHPRISSSGPMLTPLGFQGAQTLLHQSGPVIGRRHFSTEPSGSNRSQYKTSVKIPEPKSAITSNSMFSLASFDPKTLVLKLLESTWSITKTVIAFLGKLPKNIFFYMTHHQERRDKIQVIKHHAKKELDHYWTGTKLLMADVRTARDLLRQTLAGSTLTRRERKQLLRTVTDLFRLVPFSMFLIIPAAEFALPFALRLFPNMLPSTFQDSLKAEENMKRELQSRIAMAHFFQDTLQELAKEQKRIAAKRNVESPDNEIANKQEQSAQSMLEFLEGARQGEMMPPEVIIQYAKYFQDDLTLDNMPRMQLVNMCRYMQLQPYGADSFLRFQLRHRIRQLKEDDQRIIWEGIDHLTKMELREACQERGMRSTGLSKEAYIRSLQQWLDLSVNKNVPISLLIMSRTFFLQEEITRSVTGDEEAKSVASLADAISGMDKEVLNEVILEVATKEEKKSNPDIRKIKLEVVTQQNERIREEREAAEKKKKVPEKLEALPSSEEPLAPIELELSPEQAEKLVQVVGKKDEPHSVILNATTKESVARPEEVLKQEVEQITLKADDERDNELSAAEMDAISQLLSADPVSKEREQLARLKYAISEKDTTIEGEKREESVEFHTDAGISKVDDKAPSVNESSVMTSDDQAAAAIKNIEKLAADEAANSTRFSTSSELIRDKDASVGSDASPIVVEEEIEDPVVARLKKRLASMVDKIELQLSDVEREIGDKLHILDKDADGVLSQAEMAECLRGVLKREITFEEAMEIAATMDENEDGLFTVQELYNWIETNKLVRFQSEGRDADMDRIMESKDEAHSGDSVDPTEAKKQATNEKTQQESQ